MLFNLLSSYTQLSANQPKKQSMKFYTIFYRNDKDININILNSKYGTQGTH